MTPIKKLLDQIKWDERLKPEDFRIYYIDRKVGKLIEIRYLDIIKFEDFNFVIMKGGEEVSIPYHKIRRVTKHGFTYWKRPEQNEL